MHDIKKAPLADLRVVVIAGGVAAAYAARMLSTLGAETILVEPPHGSDLRREPPFLTDDSNISSLFAFLAAGARSYVADLHTEEGRRAAGSILSESDVLICDTPLKERQLFELDEATVAKRYPRLVHVSVLPFGAVGEKANWLAEEINLQHASGEGNLLPNGLTAELFPDRPPLKIYGHFASLQGGTAAALGALSALLVRDEIGGQFVDIASQDAALAVGAFAVQRYGDGAVENRFSRSFTYGGVLPCRDGYVELLTLEQRQWVALVELLGNPEWAREPAFEDPLERSRRGAEINGHLRAWAKKKDVADIVSVGQDRGIPIAKYFSPKEVLSDPHERERGLFTAVSIPGFGVADILVAPFQFGAEALSVRNGPPVLGELGGASGAPAERGALS